MPARNPNRGQPVRLVSGGDGGQLVLERAVNKTGNLDASKLNKLQQTGSFLGVKGSQLLRGRL